MRILLTAVVLAALAWEPVMRAQDDYAASIETWRAEREARLTADDGWLTVAGLFFLREGENGFGSDPLRDIVLPSGPPDAGAFVLRDGRVTLRAAAGATLSVDGKEVTAAELWPYENERPELTIGPLTLFAHTSGPRLAIRMLDRDSAILRDFAGLDWYPVDADYRVRGRFVPHPSRGRCASRTSWATSRRSPAAAPCGCRSGARKSRCCRWTRAASFGSSSAT